MENKWILGINPCVYGMNYHDPSVALFCNNKLICAIEEERINRNKNSKGIFPLNSIKKCCEIAGINLEDISLISIGYNPEKRKDRFNLEVLKTINNSGINTLISDITDGRCYSKEDIKKKMNKFNLDFLNLLENENLSSISYINNLLINEIGAPLTIKFQDHHLSHAASAFFSSDFSNSLIFVIDGVGEFETLTIWEGKNNNIYKLENKNLPYSLGYLYSIFTAFLGFEPWSDEGKTMALAPYGDMKPEIYTKILNIKDELILNSFGSSLAIDLKKSNEILEKEFRIPVRRKNDKINKNHKDIAATIQYFLENEIINIVKDSIKKYKINNIACAGGVFLNCKLNMKLRECELVKDSYFQPVSNDGGLSLGAALLEINNPKSFKLEKLNLGISYEEKDILKILLNSKIKYKKFSIKNQEFFNYISDKLANKKIVFWFNGGFEFGPRALGSRSILADPRDENLSKFINKNIKNRENWRPFGCSILLEYAGEILENFKHKSPFMIETYKVKKKWKNKIPGAIHSIDDTTRPQTVDKNLEDYYALIKSFHKLTGIPLLLNTSLNDKGEPIINTPKEALKFFYSSSADILVLENYIIEK